MLIVDRGTVTGKEAAAAYKRVAEAATNRLPLAASALRMSCFRE